MKITAIVNTPSQLNVTLDTVESITTYMTDRVLLVIDDVGYDKLDISKLSVDSIKGFRHGCKRSPYRNFALGLLRAYNKWPDSDWFLFTDYDALVGSSAFRDDLTKAQDDNVWMIGNDLRRNQSVKLELVEQILKTKFNEMLYLFGACLFYNKVFVKKLMEENFLENLLSRTNNFQYGFFPGYSAWDVTEHMMPTLANHWGGDVQQFANWKDNWTGFYQVGNYRRYPIRWKPELSKELKTEEYLQASIMHPIKTYDHPIRKFHRNKRLRQKSLA